MFCGQSGEMVYFYPLGKEETRPRGSTGGDDRKRWRDHGDFDDDYVPFHPAGRRRIGSAFAQEWVDPNAAASFNGDEQDDDHFNMTMALTEMGYLNASTYAEGIISQGYNTLENLFTEDEDTIRKVCRNIKMKKPHINAFLVAWQANLYTIH